MIEKEVGSSKKHIQSELNKLIDDLAFHIKEDHQGYPQTTCHRCLLYRQRIQVVQEDLRDAQKTQLQDTTESY